jgi:hypothetical protein
MPHCGHPPTPRELAQLGGYLPLAPGVSTVRYPIPERIFDYVSTVRNATAGNVPGADVRGGCTLVGYRPQTRSFIAYRDRN